jgi:hypothetical protein
VLYTGSEGQAEVPGKVTLPRILHMRGDMCCHVSLSLQCFIELAHSALLHRGQNVAVNVHGHANLIVPQKLLHHFRMHSHAQQDCRSAVPEVVEANFR